MNIKTESIRALQEAKSTLRQEYEAKVAELDARIADIRRARGTKLKTYENVRHFEQGRDQVPTNGNW